MTAADLFATPATVRALSEARAAVVLVGSYDGSGNYGDIAQFDAAMELVGRLGPAVVALPVLERVHLRNHDWLAEESGVNAPFALFLDGNGEADDGLVAAPAPRELAFGACYLYGGGYLNGAWGERKLAMLEAAESLLAGAGVATPARVASGLQVDPAWIEGCAPTLQSFDLLGARDPISGAAFVALGGEAEVRETGDDAVGVLRRLTPAKSPAANDEALHLNLHFAEHEWMGERPETVLDFYRGFVAELGRLAERPLRIQPLIAYFDGRIDEHPAAERLRAACADLGAEVAETLVLRPATLAEAVPQLGGAALTLSCSYHVALTSLLLEVPAILVGDNPYYEQKAAGLTADFGLPAAFTITSSVDSAEQAAAVFPFLFEDGDRQEARRGITEGASRLRQRRTEAEMELLTRLGRGALSGLASLAVDQDDRLRRRSAEPAQLHVQLAEIQTELEEQRQLAAESPLDVELRAQEAEARAEEAHRALAVALGSRSWRMAAPLRRAGSLLRRR
ncbi:MAG TPA: polysaccharide pyruvyl transferase family protein [Solirubrobacterales bacterium]|nr:polysaccharide pyruvyl transferase family protein [Solirubrobacterales bacterium]